MTAPTILLVLAIVCWFIAVIPAIFKENPINMVALGLVFYGLSMVVK